MKHSNVLRYYAGSILLYFFMTVVKTQQSCPRPDVPVNGNYRPRQSRFLLGDEVNYFCNENFLLLGNESRKCKSNGAWSNKTPFCEQPVKLKNPQVKHRPFSDSSISISKIIDGNTSTCFHWWNNPGENLQLFLDKQVILHSVRLFSEKSSVNIALFTGTNKNTPCANFDRFIDKRQWVLIKLTEENLLADTLFIRSKGSKDSNITICEIQVYSKDESGCEQPPEFSFPNGYFEVSRSKATLVCEEGYKSENSRIACEGNTWKEFGPRCEEILCEPYVSNATLPPGSGWKFLDEVKKISAGTRRQLQCGTGYYMTGSPVKVSCQRNGTWTKTNATCIEEEKPESNSRTILLGAVGAIVAIIILSLLGVTIYLIKNRRYREVVVVFKPSADDSISPGMENEYATAYYETIQCSVPVPPTTPRPAELTAVLSESYILPKESKGTLKKQPPIPSDIAFGTLKQSTLYGN